MVAYYNENDPKTAKWLRQLIEQKLIADGDVDERDIRDVKAEEIRGYTQHHFFAGIGGWSLALRQAGWPDDRPVITGSCPCQPFSSAGKKDGTKDKRHLWPEMFRLITGLPESKRPPTIFGEQVAQKAGQAWFDALQADLARENYAAGLVVFPACSVGAPHLRQRLYWFADYVDDSDSTGRFGPDGRRILGRGETAEGTRQTESAVSGVTDNMENTRSKRPDGQSICVQQKQGKDPQIAGRGSTDGVADNAGIGCEGVSRSGATQDARVTKLCKNDGAGPTNGFWENPDWLWCQDQKWRCIEPRVEPLADGVPNRMVKLRGYGNAIVVPQAKEFIQSYMDIELELFIAKRS